MLTDAEMRAAAISAAEFVDDMISAYDDCARDYPQYLGDRKAVITESAGDTDWDRGVISIDEHEHVRILFGFEFHGASLVVKPTLAEDGWQPMNQHLTDVQKSALNKYVKHVLRALAREGFRNGGTPGPLLDPGTTGR